MVILVAVATVVVAGVLLAVRSALPDAGHLQRTAEAFPAPARWAEPVVTTEPARLVCLGDNPCPSTQLSWTVPESTTLEDFTAVLDDTGWGLQMSASCALSVPPPTGNARMCTATGEVDGVEIRASYRSTRPEGEGPGAVSVSARYP